MQIETMSYFITVFRSESIRYVINAPFFWQAMAGATIVAMFVGATLHNGDFSSSKKTAISLLSYITMLWVTTMARVYPVFERQKNFLTPDSLAQVFANPVTILFLSLFWFLGFFWGIFLVNRARKH